MYGCVAGQSMSPTSAQFYTIFRFTWHIIVVIYSAPPQADTTNTEGRCAAMTVKQWDAHDGAPKTLAERLEEDAGDAPLA
jgi:hypothetical protein